MTEQMVVAETDYCSDYVSPGGGESSKTRLTYSALFKK